MLIDTHCHLYAEEFDADIAEVMQRSVASGVRRIFLPAIDTESHDRLHKLLEKSSPECELLPMMGLHPCSVKENAEGELRMIEQYLNSNTKYYAIGEIGLDYYWDLSFKEKQIEVFERQIGWSVQRKLPVAIHSRESTGDCIKSVKKFVDSTGVFHCFGGTLDEAKEIIDLGYYLGIGGVVTYKKTNLREILAEGEWWLALFPGAALMLAVFTFNLLGDGLRDLVDPLRRT
jgi:TatD DNase family protein